MTTLVRDSYVNPKKKVDSGSCLPQTTRSREVTICDLDKEYIRKFFIDSLISLAQDRDPQFRYYKFFIVSFSTFLQDFVVIGIQDLEEFHSECSKTTCQIISILRGKGLTSRLDIKALFPQLFHYILRQHLMPPILPCHPRCLLPIQSTVVSVPFPLSQPLNFLFVPQSNSASWELLKSERMRLFKHVSRQYSSIQVYF